MRVMPVRAMRNGQEDLFASPEGGESFPRAPLGPFLSNSLDSNTSYEDIDGDNNRKCLRSPFVSEEDLDSRMFIEGEPLSMLFTQNLDLNNDILNMKKPIAKDNWQHMSADSLNENYQSPVTTGKANVAAMLKSHPSPNTANGNMEALQESSIASDATTENGFEEEEETCFEYTKLTNDVTEPGDLCSNDSTTPKEGRNGNVRMYSFPKYSDEFSQNIAVEMLQRQGGGGLHSSLEVNCSNSVNASPWSDSHSSYESNDSYNAYGHDSAFLWEGVDEYCDSHTGGEEFQLAMHRLSVSCPKMDRLRCRDRHSYPPCQSSRHGYTVIVDGFENGDLQHSISYPVATMKTPEGYYLQAPLNSHKYRARNRRRESKSRGRTKSTMEGKTPSPFNLKKSRSKSYEKLSSEIFARWSMESSGFSKSHGNSSHSNCSSLVDDGMQRSPLPSVTRAHSFGSADLNRRERPTVSRAHSMSSADRSSSSSPTSKLKKDTWKQRCIRSKSYEKLSLRLQSASDEDFCANPEIVCPVEDSDNEEEPKTPDTAKRVTFAEIAQRKKNMSLPVQPLIDSNEGKDRLDTGKHSDEGVFSGEWTEGGNECEEKRRWSEKERKERLNSEGIEVDEEEEDDGIIENASGNEVAMEESLKLRRESLESEKAEEASGRSRLFSDPGPKMMSEVTLRDNDPSQRPLKARPHSLPIRPYALAFPLSGQMPRVRRVQKCPSLKTFNGMSRPLAQRSLSCSPYRNPAPVVQVLETQQKKPLAALRQLSGGGLGSSNSHAYFPLAHHQPPKSADYQITHHAKGFGNHDNQLLPRSAGYHSNHVTPKWEFHGNLRFEKVVVKEKIQPLFRSALDVHKRGIKVSVVSPGNRGIPVTVSSYQLPAMKGWQKDGDAEEEMTSYVAIETPPDNIPLSPSCSGEFILVDLRRKKALVSAVNSAVDAILGHFGEAREPSAKARLGNSSKTPNIGHLVLRYLCPAVLALVEDGLRPFLRNPIVGRVKNNVWNVVEASTQMGPATKSLHKLYNHLSKTGQMWDVNMRFNAFVCGLLNLKAVELWLTHLQARYDIVQKHYIPEAFLTLSYTAGRQLFDDVVVIVQPLSLLPFALDTQFEFNIKQEEMEREIGKQRLKEEAARTSPRSTFQMMTGKRVPRYQPISSEKQEEQEEVLVQQVVVDRRPEETPVEQNQSPKEEVDSAAGEEQQPTEQPKNQNWWFQLMNSTPVEAAADRKTSQTTSTVSEASSEANTTSVRSKLWLSNLIGAGPRPNQEARSKVKVTSEVKQEDEQKPPNGRKSRWASFSSSFIQAVDRVLLPTSSRAGQTPPPSPRQCHGNQTPPSSPRQQHSNQTPPSSPTQQHSNQTLSPRQHHGNQMPSSSPRQCHSNQIPSPRQQHSDQTVRRVPDVLQTQRRGDKRVVKALCHHLATEDGQLSLTKGDILTVVQKVDDDWLLCCHGDKTGLVLMGCVNDLDLL
ncbi:uncharacterized protein LOC144908453 isoform X1 [Branchiostoma floridae x Branchiostoma belcheri]